MPTKGDQTAVEDRGGWNERRTGQSVEENSARTLAQNLQIAINILIRQARQHFQLKVTQPVTQIAEVNYRKLTEAKAGWEILERETGFEPATSTLARSHSTTELLPLTELHTF